MLYLLMCNRGVEELGPSFSLPTCAHVFNIYHPVSRMRACVRVCVCTRACTVYIHMYACDKHVLVNVYVYAHAHKHFSCVIVHYALFSLSV